MVEIRRGFLFIVVFSCLALGAFAQECDSDCEIENLKAEVAVLKEQLANQTTEVSSLRALLLSLEQTIIGIKNWLFFDEQPNVCNVIGQRCNQDIQCIQDSDCGGQTTISSFCQLDEAWKTVEVPRCIGAGTPESHCISDRFTQLDNICEDGCLEGACIHSRACFSSSDCDSTISISSYCRDGAVWEQLNLSFCANPGTPTARCEQASQDTLVEHCENGCEKGECVESVHESVVFRTNVEKDDFYNSFNSWIVVDRDRDGTLEGYDMRAKGGWSGARCNTNVQCGLGSVPCVIVRTPLGTKVVDYGNPNQVVVCDFFNRKQIFYSRGSASAVTDSDSVEPFSSNMQESYS